MQDVVKPKESNNWWKVQGSTRLHCPHTRKLFCLPNCTLLKYMVLHVVCIQL